MGHRYLFHQSYLHSWSTLSREFTMEDDDVTLIGLVTSGEDGFVIHELLRNLELSVEVHSSTDVPTSKFIGIATVHNVKCFNGTLIIAIQQSLQRLTRDLFQIRVLPTANDIGQAVLLRIVTNKSRIVP